MNADGAHVIAVGNENEKGGTGKSTTAFHLAIYLLYDGFNVASIDVDSRQQTLTHYVRNRRGLGQVARAQSAPDHPLSPAPVARRFYFQQLPSGVRGVFSSAG